MTPLHCLHFQIVEEWENNTRGYWKNIFNDSGNILDTLLKATLGPEPGSSFQRANAKQISIMFTYLPLTTSFSKFLYYICTGKTKISLHLC